MNYETAYYVLSNQDGTERGPIRGKVPTKEAAMHWQSSCQQGITIRVHATDEEVAILWPDGRWMLPDRRDAEGNHLPRMEW